MEQRTRLITTRALVLRLDDTGERDQRITFLTERLGKMVVRAKGSKKLLSRFLGHLDLGNICATTLARGSTDRYVLAGCRVEKAFSHLKKTREGLAVILHAVTVFDHVLREGQGAHLFEKVETLLQQAEQNGEAHRTIRAAFNILGQKELGVYVEER